jgi:site-specific DNA recombinase
MQSRTRTATAPKKHIITNILYCEECQKGMWFKANQKGYRCGGNIRHGNTFCLNTVAVWEKELMHVIMVDLQSLFNSLKEENFLIAQMNKLNVKKRKVIKQLEAVQPEIETLRNKKLEYVDLYTENVISKDDLVEYRELMDNKIKDLQIKKAELNEKQQECDNEDYAFNIGKKLKDVLNLKELTPQVLHSLVEKITCKNDGTIHIQYSFVNPLQER